MCVYYVCMCVVQVGSNSSLDYCQLQFDYCNGMRMNDSGHYPYRECNKVSTGVSVTLLQSIFIILMYTHTYMYTGDFIGRQYTNTDC